MGSIVSWIAVVLGMELKGLGQLKVGNDVGFNLNVMFKQTFVQLLLSNPVVEFACPVRNFNYPWQVDVYKL